MARADDVIALVHDLSSAALADTLIGAPVKSSEGVNRSDQPSTSEQCNSDNPTKEKAEKPNTSPDRDHKKPKYSSMSAEVCPTRDREVLQKKLAKKIDVRYLNEIKNFKEKIKSSYQLSCNEQQCPMMQERLIQHKEAHHSNYKSNKVDYACGTRTKIRDKAINVSPTLSRMRLPKFTLPLADEGRLVQTEISMRDFSPNRIFAQKPLNKITSDVSTKYIPLRKSETRDVICKKNFYKEHLQNEILNWLHHVPMFYSLNFTTNDIKNNIVTNLAEKINALAVDAQENDYELRTKIEIENCLSRLPMWLHGPKRDQVLFKEGLKEKLWYKILGLNENFLGIKYKKAVSNENLEEKIKAHESYEKEVSDWSQRIQIKPGKNVSRQQLVDLMMKRLSPLLKIPLHTTSYKLILKAEIIDILDDLPLTLTSAKYRTVYLNRFAEELTNKLLNVQLNEQYSNSQNPGKSTAYVCSDPTKRLSIPQQMCYLKDLILHRVGKCLDKVPVCHRNDLKTEICSSFIDSKCRLRTGKDMNIKDEICQFLRDTGKITEDRTETVANMIVEEVNHAIIDARNTATTSFDSVIPQLSGTISVYRWGSDGPVTSTPKKPKTKEIPKLNTEEITYTNRVAALIRHWMNTLPKQYNDDPTFKETIINDLAGELTDHHKVQQLAPDTFDDKDKYQRYVIYKWLYKFDFFEEGDIRVDAKPVVADLMKKLNEVQVPVLIAPQHGTRTALGHMKHMETERGWEEDYIPKGIDVLEDQISVWMNEQPSELYKKQDKGKRDKQIHDLALNLQDRLRDKSPESAIDQDINEWLQIVVNPKEKEHIGLLAQDLKEKIINVPQDQTLAAKQEERQRYIAAKLASKRQIAAGQAPVLQLEDVSNIGNIKGDPDKSIRKFIAKYMDRYYNIEDPMTKAALAHLLKLELRKLAPTTRQEVYDNFEQNRTHEMFRPENFRDELEYIKIVSDWLKILPVDPMYNVPENSTRREFVNDLAKSIQELEEQRMQNPDAMEYNYYTAAMILQSLNTYEVPILRDHKENTPYMAEQLLHRIRNRQASVPAQAPRSRSSSPDPKSLSQSLNISDIKEQNMSDFINDYIRINGREIAHDEIKLEAWTARLMKEVNNMAQGGADPNTLNKAQVYERFAEIPIPNDEDVEQYQLEKYYINEITDWMKNLPLLPVAKQPEYEKERTRNINELAEKMCDTDAQKRAYPDDNKADKQLEGYIPTWISKQPLDKSKEINLPILIQQLMNRIHKRSQKVRERETRSIFEVTESFSDDSDVGKKNKKSKSLDGKDSKASIPKKGSREKFPFNLLRKSKSPAETIVQAIEKWANKLPINGDDKQATKAMKEAIALRLYQKTGELNVDPRIFNDDLLYREMLGDEIDTLLENVPQNPELQKNREKLKVGLLNTITNTNKIIKENSAGDNYRHKLETTIDSSIPNPVQTTQVFDPGFEIYKHYLARMFILENFDHSNEDIKAKYERRIKHEIDKYFESAQNKNAIPLTKDQINNEIYCALFKVPRPHENSLIDEVEQIKTKCEVDAWYEELPVQETNDNVELLNREKILTTLTKRIHEMECKNECRSDDKIQKEIQKWLDKLPLIPGHKGHEFYAKKLLTRLKETDAARRYVALDPKTLKGKSKLPRLSWDKKGLKGANTSQVAGPSGMSKATSAKPCLQVGPMTNKKPGDIINEVVDQWCNQLPLMSSEENNKAIKDNISTRIIIHISELNMNPEIFYNDVVYNELLDEELEKVLTNLPVPADFENTKIARKYQLKEMIHSIKPLIREEKARHEYKEELNSTVTNILKEPLNTTADKLAEFERLKEEIVENFVQYNYNKNDEEGRQIYKKQVHDAVVKYCIDVRDKSIDEQIDPLIRRNQLLCELEKIPVPETALKEEVAEIKMKQEVDQLFREQSIPEGNERDKMKKYLSKRLCEIEKSGYTPENEKKMKSDVDRSLKKFKGDVSPKVADDFINRLKYSEAERKTPPMTRSQAAYLDEGYDSPKPRTPYEPGTEYTYDSQRQVPQTPQQKYTESDNVEHWISSLPETPHQMPDYSYHSSYAKDRPEAHTWSPHGARQHDHSLGHSTLSYEDFRGGNILSSSVAPHPHSPQTQTWSPHAARHDRSLGQSTLNYDDFQGGGLLSSSVVPRGYIHGPDLHGLTDSPPTGVTSAYADRSHRISPKSKGISNHPEVSVRTGPNFGQITTPRQVAQTPHSPTLSPVHSQTPGDVTPESLFQAPVFKPTPLHRPLPVPIIDPIPYRASTASMHGARRPISGQERALTPRRLPAPSGRPDDRKLKIYESSDDDEVCICERCAKLKCNGIPYYMLAMEQYFEDCLGIPLWCRKNCPECFYR